MLEQLVDLSQAAEGGSQAPVSSLSVPGTQQHHEAPLLAPASPAWALVGPRKPPLLPLVFPSRVVTLAPGAHGMELGWPPVCSQAKANVLTVLMVGGQL